MRQQTEPVFVADVPYW